MKPIRRLALRRETLVDLSPDQLAGVVAGRATGTVCSVVEDCATGHQLCSMLCPQSWETEPC